MDSRGKGSRRARFGEDGQREGRKESMTSSEKRLGFVGVVVNARDEIGRVNQTLSEYGRVIRGRIGVPNPEDGTAVIGLIVEGSNEEIGALTGRLGNIPGITVKSALTGKK